MDCLEGNFIKREIILRVKKIDHAQNVVVHVTIIADPEFFSSIQCSKNPAQPSCLHVKLQCACIERKKHL
jgi:hypothetical protein